MVPRVAGRPSREEVGIPEAAEDSWVLEESDTVASVLADYRAGVGRGGRDAAPYDLDDLAVHNRRGPLTLRWIYVHMVEELARHAGHGDILREQVLAAARKSGEDFFAQAVDPGARAATSC